MENTELTSLQRENIKNQLMRRIGKMDDAAILQLEQATRHPHEKPRPEVEKDTKDEAEIAAGPIVVNRRQAITYGVTGVLALLATSTGIGWGKSLREGEELRAQGEDLRGELQDQSAQLEALREHFNQLKDDDFDTALRSALEEMNTELISLKKLADELSVKKAASAKVIDNYQTEILPKTQESVTQLKAVTGWIDELRSAPYLDEAMDVLLYMVENRDLKSFFAFLKAYDVVVPTIVAYLHSIPNLVDANHNAVANLSPWLATETGIDSQLFQPIEGEMFHAFDATSRQVKSVQTLAQEKLTVAIERFLDKRDQFYNALEEK